MKLAEFDKLYGAAKPDLKDAVDFIVKVMSRVESGAQNNEQNKKESVANDRR